MGLLSDTVQAVQAGKRASGCTRRCGVRVLRTWGPGERWCGRAQANAPAEDRGTHTYPFSRAPQMQEAQAREEASGTLPTARRREAPTALLRRVGYPILTARVYHLGQLLIVFYPVTSKAGRNSSPFESRDVPTRLRVSIGHLLVRLPFSLGRTHIAHNIKDS